MEALAFEVAERLDADRPIDTLLGRVGEADPDAPRALALASAQPDLAESRPLWLPALLLSARPGAGARHLCAVAEAHREACESPLDLRAAPILPRLLGCSDFLARLLGRRPDWVRELHSPVTGTGGAAHDLAEDTDWSEIRRAKYRGLLRVAAGDLSGRPMPESFGDLSHIADACLTAALDRAAEDVGAPAPALLALGKLGGCELNFSSDVDLMFVFDDVASPGSSIEGASRVIRAFKRGLETRDAEGFTYRVDLDLRPEGRVGTLAHSADAALDYYELRGAEWERQMLIRLRHVAGPATVATRFARDLEPFVYRKLIDPGVIDDVRAMKSRIEAERRDGGRDVESDLKEGPGGIRDVEFFVQSLQLFYGGEYPALRTGNVLDALEALASASLVPDAVVSSLADAYVWLRRAEHAVQLREEQQTAAFPRDPEGQLGLARRLGYGDTDGARARDELLDDWTTVRAEVRGHFDALVLESAQ